LLALFSALLFAVPGGQYTGTWTSDGGVNSGKVNLTISESGEGDLSFTYQDQLVKPKKVTAKVAGDKIEFICEIELEGLRLKTSFQGTADGKSLSGKYQSTGDDGSILDSGTWKVTQQ
jgi:hypothetical protein